MPIYGELREKTKNAQRPSIFIAIQRERKENGTLVSLFSAISCNFSCETILTALFSAAEERKSLHRRPVATGLSTRCCLATRSSPRKSIICTTVSMATRWPAFFSTFSSPANANLRPLATGLVSRAVDVLLAVAKGNEGQWFIGSVGAAGISVGCLRTPAVRPGTSQCVRRSFASLLFRRASSLLSLYHKNGKSLFLPFSPTFRSISSILITVYWIWTQFLS